MEVRCGSCNKLFRVSDDKIAGAGIRFACSRCGEYVKITREDFDTYALSKSTVSVLDMFTPKPKPAKAGARTESNVEEAAAPEPSLPAMESPVPEQIEPSAPEPDVPEPSVEDVFNSPEFTSMLRPTPEPQPKAEAGSPEAEPPHITEKEVRSEAQKESVKNLESALQAVRATAPPKPQAQSQVSGQTQRAEPAPPALEGLPKTLPASRSGVGKWLTLVILVIVVLGGAAYGVFWYMRASSNQPANMAPALVSMEGLQITGASGSVDPATGDLVLTGEVENNTDKERPAWYLVADVYDVQGTTLVQAKMLNGKQLYTQRDYDIMTKRGMNIQDVMNRSLQEKGVPVPPKGSVHFEIRVMDPPAETASFTPSLHPFDPVQIYKDLASEQKRQ